MLERYRAGADPEQPDAEPMQSTWPRSRWSGSSGDGRADRTPGPVALPHPLRPALAADRPDHPGDDPADAGTRPVADPDRPGLHRAGPGRAGAGTAHRRPGRRARPPDRAGHRLGGQPGLARPVRWPTRSRCSSWSGPCKGSTGRWTAARSTPGTSRPPWPSTRTPSTSPASAGRHRRRRHHRRGALLSGGLIALGPVGPVSALTVPVLVAAALQAVALVVLLVLLVERRPARGPARCVPRSRRHPGWSGRPSAAAPLPGAARPGVGGAVLGFRHGHLRVVAAGPARRRGR